MVKSAVLQLDGKKVALLGFGREGKATYALLRKYLPDLSITVCDLKEQSPVEGDNNLFFETGENYQKNLLSFDVVFKSPGIVLEDPSEELLRKVTSQTELFLSLYGDRTIGVTGTKGKSTTASLIAHVLKENGVDALLLGNIGIAAFTVLEQIGENTVPVYELSCHQLEYEKYSPKTAVLLNFFEEHLDHYGTFENYKNAKKNIFLHQKNTDRLFVLEDCLSEIVPVSNTVTFSRGKTSDIFIDDRTVVYGERSITVDEHLCPLKGSHNMYNIAAAYGVALDYGISDEGFLRALYSFKTLPHRMQYFGCYHGIHWYDDSISTVGATLMGAVESLKSVGSLIIGGMDRGIDYSDLISFLPDCKAKVLIFLPDSGWRILREMEAAGKDLSGKLLLTAKDLREAVALAKAHTPKGDSCLLSPAAASYGYFRDFEERGDCFQTWAKED